MAFDSQTITRFIFLLFIVCISTYFIFINKDIVERFDDSTQAETSNLPSDKNLLAKTVKEIYSELQFDEPTQKAVDFYVDFAFNRSLTRNDFKEIIESSAASLEKTFQDASEIKNDQNDIFGTEDEVEEIYNEILFRNPDNAELYNFAKLLKTDSSFSLEKLKQILYASEEYRRMEKTQTNMVYSNLMGGITNRQLTFIVNTIYKEVTGDELNDEDTLKFLKKKLLQFNLDQDVFKQFIAMYVQGKPFEREQRTKDEEKHILQDAIKNAAAQKIKQVSDSISQKDLEKTKKDILAEVFKSIENQPKPEQVQPNPNHQVIEVLLRTAKDSQREDYLDSQSILKTIKEEAKCVFDKDAVEQDYASRVKDKNANLAKLIDQRNTEELGNICKKNLKFLGVDEDMVLDPSLRWSVPQPRPPICLGNNNRYQPVVDQTALIGTLLEQAKDTEVGSILPEIPPR